MRTNAKIYVAGHRGLVGSALLRRLRAAGHTNLVCRTSTELDLTDRADVDAFFAAQRPDYVFLAAARVGGIVANARFPVEFVRDNLAIALHVIDAAHRYGAEKLLFLGSSCIYPKQAAQPVKEEYLLSGELEPTNKPYAIAKIAGIELCQAYRRQHGADFISAMPTNIYGPNDNFDLATSHVLPALIRKMHDAKTAGHPSVTVWGTGRPRREFLHADDLADACIHLMRTYSASEPINVGVGSDITIRELAELVRSVVGFGGHVVYDPAKPDGTPRKLLDISRLNRLGWRARMPLRSGIEQTYAWYRANEVTNAGTTSLGATVRRGGAGRRATKCSTA